MPWVAYTLAVEADLTSSGRAAVVGAGSWGTALAMHLARRGTSVRLWSRNEAQAATMQATRRNPSYLQEFEFPAGVEATADLSVALEGADLVVWALPSHGLRDVVRLAVGALKRAHVPPLMLIAAKGVEVESLSTMDEVLRDELPAVMHTRVAVLGGPSFASEVAQGLPTTVVVAARDAGTRESIQRRLSDPVLRAYETEDVLGVEIGGAFKNVIALAAGIGDGAGLGQNARAGLITRGLAEISRLAVALGANPATLFGLAGVGDLVLTCTGGLSRNRRVGMALGEGKTLDTILAEMGMVAEGVLNTKSAYRLAKREGVEMPIVSVMYAILYDGLAVPEAVDALMGRRLKPERG